MTRVSARWQVRLRRIGGAGVRFRCDHPSPGSCFGSRPAMRGSHPADIDDVARSGFDVFNGAVVDDVAAAADNPEPDQLLLWNVVLRRFRHSHEKEKRKMFSLLSVSPFCWSRTRTCTRTRTRRAWPPPPPPPPRRRSGSEKERNGSG